MAWQGSDADTACPCESWAGTQLEKGRPFAKAKEGWAHLGLKEKQKSEHESVPKSVKTSLDQACHKVSSCRLLTLK